MSFGASRIKLDTITRQLRVDGLLPVGGHGPFAPALQPEHAARILIANAGSTKAVQASSRLAVLAKLQNPKGRTLLEALTAQLAAQAVDIDEVRVSRRSDVAVLKTGDSEDIYFGANYDRSADHIRTEGIITGHALEQVRSLLAGPSPAQRRRQRKRRKVG